MLKLFQDLKFWPTQQAYPASPVAIATNIFNTIYHNDKYQNLQRPENISNKFFGSESLSTKFSETFTENYQQTDGINFPNYESHKSDGYQDLAGNVECDSDKKRKKKKKNKHWFSNELLIKFLTLQMSAICSYLQFSVWLPSK